MYTSDITREQFNTIAPILEGAKKKTRPRSLDLHDIFNGLLYVVKNGCTWRDLPKDYPKWKTVHYYFTVWSAPQSDGSSILEQVLKKISRLRTYQRWQETMHEHGYRRCAECKKYRHCQC